MYTLLNRIQAFMGILLALAQINKGVQGPSGLKICAYNDCSNLANIVVKSRRVYKMTNCQELNKNNLMSKADNRTV